MGYALGRSTEHLALILHGLDGMGEPVVRLNVNAIGTYMSINATTWSSASDEKLTNAFGCYGKSFEYIAQINNNQIYLESR